MKKLVKLFGIINIVLVFFVVCVYPAVQLLDLADMLYIGTYGPLIIVVISHTAFWALMVCVLMILYLESVDRYWKRATHNQY